MERVVRRRLRSRTDSHQGMLDTNHCARPTRRLRRNLARSRSVGSCTRERSHRHTYARSQSCPEHPSHINTYKITENKTDYIFQMAMPGHVCCIPQPKSLAMTVSLNPEEVTKPQIIFNRPKSNRTNIQQSQHNCVYYYLDRHTQSLDTNDYQTKIVQATRQRRLPHVEKKNLNFNVRLLPSVPSFNGHSVVKETSKDTLMCSENVDAIENEEKLLQYNGYNSEGSEAETTIHVSMEKQNSLDIETSKIHKNQSIDKADSSPDHCNNINEATIKSGKKKTLSLDLKTNYETKNIIQTQSLDVHENKETVITSKQELIDFIENNEKPKNNENPHRRNSDSLVILKTSPPSTPDQIKNMFKRMSIGSKDHSNNMSNETIQNKQDEDNGIKKIGNTVSINEVPTFQEYQSPSSFCPQSSVDLSIRKPLPSIIKKARLRSYSLTATDHLDCEFSIMANSLSVALSPPNLRSSRRVLTPVASYLPLGDTHPNILDASMELSTSDDSVTCGRSKSMKWASPQNQNKCDANDKILEQPRGTGKPSTHRSSKRSNDYGGRENGRNNQPQPLERRESRRGPFTRSLSNADVPPDEKTGNTKIYTNALCVAYTNI